jgi:hypothetical protein
MHHFLIASIFVKLVAKKVGDNCVLMILGRLSRLILNMLFAYQVFDVLILEGSRLAGILLFCEHVRIPTTDCKMFASLTSEHLLIGFLSILKIVHDVISSYQSVKRVRPYWHSLNL